MSGPQCCRCPGLAGAGAVGCDEKQRGVKMIMMMVVVVVVMMMMMMMMMMSR